MARLRADPWVPNSANAWAISAASNLERLGRAMAAASQAWTGAGAPSVTIAFRGREATVRGIVPDATAHLLVVQAIRHTSGVRSVVDLLETRQVVPPPTPAPVTVPPTTAIRNTLSLGVMRARSVDGRVTLEGSVADEATRNRLIGLLRPELKEQLFDNLRTGPGDPRNAGPATSANLVRAFGRLVVSGAPRVVDGSISLSESTVVMRTFSDLVS